MTSLPFKHAAVIGLGLIGGSVARDLAALGMVVSAYDADPAQLAAAMRDGVVQHQLDATLGGLANADLVVVAVPVDNALEVLRLGAPHLKHASLITDVGSTKARIVALATELGIGDRFVGAHPMAGDHRSGWMASRIRLFVDAPLYLCPAMDSIPQAKTLAESLWRTLGARPIEMDAVVHDEHLAWTSHLPHMIAVVLGLTLGEGGVGREDLGPGGRDMTRIAGSSPDMWTAIAVDNADPIDAALAVAEREIAVLREEIARRDAAALHARFTAARSWFSATSPVVKDMRNITAEVAISARGPRLRSG
ncbi:MAG TPA: prephenate dehydrogenase [Gemmatimonadaceae bacterium]|jgi:prephenate dehydrogenase